MSGDQDTLYKQAEAEFAPAIARLARAMERDKEKARELEQDIHCELWRSFARFDGKCALSTWVYRVAHNVAASHIGSAIRRPDAVPLEEIRDLPVVGGAEEQAAENHAIARVHTLIRQLPAVDAQVILLWLEGQSGKAIAEITGLNLSAINVRIHRIKHVLTKEFQTFEDAGGPHD
ncbi:sigma-70 family RNA polymerase sigma factor [Pontixanthobacter aestiaquae]|uniref:Sigma-70 family RNA polymerase sigma factor n=1 Tax=Pontixanthobacter aestiaquae TaxID=1509367 RepID=A0A844Z9M8_9SPHN|nr:sigma-70 family RNA polymerase sigma factor [Pontixanthobacter aestiaquae]MDN3645440.1 sigma-70 family RNA polymerase sigma factor [Pontixanthobacter aestiaquae]MXO83560.1 sigma-70 family RNA polymerase sigma factor [Pontixanthobacter aestiaquae]